MGHRLGHVLLPDHGAATAVHRAQVPLCHIQHPAGLVAIVLLRTHE